MSEAAAVVTPPAEQAPAPTATQATTPPAAAATPPAQADWKSELNDEQKGFLEVKSFKTAGDVIKSYRELETHLGVPKDRILKLPEKMDDPAAMKDVFKRLGTPEKKEDYKIDMPAVGSDPEFVNAARDAFHGLNLTGKQAEGLSQWYNKVVESGNQKIAEQQKAQVEADSLDLKKEWGMAFEENSKIADKAVTKFGMTQEQGNALRQAMGFKDAMKFLHNLGATTGEGEYIGGSGASNPNRMLSPEAAKFKIKEYYNDAEFIKKYGDGDVSARGVMDNLHKMAYPEDTA